MNQPICMNQKHVSIRTRNANSNHIVRPKCKYLLGLEHTFEIILQPDEPVYLYEPYFALSIQPTSTTYHDPLTQLAFLCV